jgi:hypothetical protein
LAAFGYENEQEGLPMVAETELRIPFEDATKVSIECGKCDTEIVVDFGKHEGTEWESINLECVVCNTKFGDDVRNTLRFLSFANRTVKDSKRKVSFRVRVTNSTNRA